MSALYEVKDLAINLYTDKGAVRPVDRVSYTVNRGECLAIVGESGSGKTVMNMAPLGLMPPGVAVGLQGEIWLDGREISRVGEPGLSTIRGKTVGAIFQDPMSALNPARRIGRQIAEVCELHLGMTSQQAEARALELLKLVDVSDPESRLRQYPHELSGGMCQRVMIAMATATEPKMLIADEPTTALDVTVQAQILEVLRDLRRLLDMAIVLITHDIGVVASIADRVAVMYAGRLVEQGPVDEVLVAPRHPYTQALVSAIPMPHDAVGAAFRGLPGQPPELAGPVLGCAFAPRCPHAFDPCHRHRPPLRGSPADRTAAACHLLTTEEMA
tara:strand:- start:2490 stop:3476 length:987 start_codon:yes stop_codon:yes gene_type:complete